MLLILSLFYVGLPYTHTVVTLFIPFALSAFHLFKWLAKWIRLPLLTQLLLALARTS